MHWIKFTPTESLSTSTRILFMLFKMSKEDDTSEGARILPSAMRIEIKRIELLLLTYSDGVSSSYQSRMAANPLLCCYRKKEKASVRGKSGSVRRDKVCLHSGGSYGTRSLYQ